MNRTREFPEAHFLVRTPPHKPSITLDNLTPLTWTEPATNII
jgi:hypothetical protein